MAIEAFNITDFPLKIVGSGPMERSLRKKSKKNIEFLGELTDKQLIFYYENCKALVFPGIEDFGLVMAEAQSYGAPVIAYKGGGAIDIIKEGVTGEFFVSQTVDSLIGVLKRFDGTIYNKGDIIRNSQRFSYKVFKTSIEKFIEKKIKT